MASKIKHIIRNPALLFLTLGQRGLFNWIDDETYLKIAFRIKMKKKLDLDNPITFNEKLQWLKLHDRRPEYSMMVDKYEAKKYVAGILGEEYVFPTLGVWDNFDEIDFEKLPEQFVLKCTHDSGGLVICKDRSKFDANKARRKIERCLKHNFYWGQREWPYKNVKPRIIAEQYMEDSVTAELRDYKFFCFSGEPKVTLVCSERFSEKGLQEDFFDESWNRIPVKRPYHPNSETEILKPIQFGLMREIARKLANAIPFVRIDFYEINNKVYFGEITFFPASGFSGFVPREWDSIFGEWIQLPEKG